MRGISKEKDDANVSNNNNNVDYMDHTTKKHIGVSNNGGLSNFANTMTTYNSSQNYNSVTPKKVY